MRSILGRLGSRLAVAALLLAGLGGHPRPAAAVDNPCTGFGITQVVLAPVLPGSFGAANQKNADCIAWQEFIYENWAADPAHPGTPDQSVPGSAFGAPSAAAPKVWQTYVPSDVLFRGDAKLSALAEAHPARLRLSALAETTGFDLNAIGQASGKPDAPQWLTDQRGGLTYYAVNIDPDEVAFILRGMPGGTNLTSFAGQASCAGQPGQAGKGGFNLPQGYGGDTDCTGAAASFGLGVGTIETKAAWVALPADHSLDYRYLTAAATITDPYGRSTDATVGLVGLHIIRRLPGAPQFLWATFEQVDNDPDNGSDTVRLPPNPNFRPGPGFTYYNPGCTPTSDPVYQCKLNTPPAFPCSGPNPPYLPTGCSPYAAPMQVTRVTPVDGTADLVTAYAWSLVPANSVVNYYRLIDVQWPSLPTAIPPQSQTPLTIGGITPSDGTRIVANTTMETYVQTTRSCMDCHRNAPIATPKEVEVFEKNGRDFRLVAVPVPEHQAAEATPAAGAPYAASYSFVFTANTKK
jgi:hypothetical protein